MSSQLNSSPGHFEELLISAGIKTKNFEEFENAYKRLRVYNEDLAHLLPKSQELDKITALYLLYLLSFNRFLLILFMCI